MRTYAAELNDNTVVRVIVGTADWATANLGGLWVDTPTKCGPGWLYIDGQIVPPRPYPSWTLIDGVWTPPVPMPDGDWMWDEDTQQWAAAGGEQ